MDQIHSMKVFLAVGEQESFVAAARRIGVSPAAVTRAVLKLEERLGVRLIRRSTRKVSLTEAGMRYLNDTRDILANIEKANDTATGGKARLHGKLSVTAPVQFGKMFVMPCIVRFLKAHPDAEVSAVFQDGLPDLEQEDIDIGVCIGPVRDPGLPALCVGQVRRLLCAAPAYLERHGAPVHPADLLRRTVIATTDVFPQVEWRFGGAGDLAMVRLRPRLAVTTNDAAIEAVTAGLGICRLLHYQVADKLAMGRLKVVLPEYEEAPWPVHLVYREGRPGASGVRDFTELLARELLAHPYLR